MEEEGTSVEEQVGFSPDDVSTIIKDSIASVLQNQQYCEPKVKQWATACIDAAMKRLTSMEKPYKYVVTCIIMQKTGAGLHTAASCFWDSTTDGTRTVCWENKTMYCIATVFALAI